MTNEKGPHGLSVNFASFMTIDTDVSAVCPWKTLMFVGGRGDDLFGKTIDMVASLCLI